MMSLGMRPMLMRAMARMSGYMVSLIDAGSFTPVERLKVSDCD